MTETLQKERLEAIWRERATRLSERLVPTTAADNTELVIVLGIGKERYGVDLSDVAEVLPLIKPTPVPGAPAVFAGVINVHGEILPVIDLRRLLGMESLPPGESARVILLRRDGREIGLQTDMVEQIRRIVSGDLQLRGTDGTESIASRHIRGSTGDLLMLVRTESLFDQMNRGVTT
jgi:purine-binding chemotaxis protein CheW